MSFMITPFLFLLSLGLSPDLQAIPLLDGESLSGWRGNSEVWRVEDGVLIGSSSPEKPLQRNEYLFWDGNASDFILELEIRVLGGNSGIQYRSTRRGAHDIEGYQADLDADNTYTGALYETYGRGLMSIRGQKRAYLFQDNRRDLGIIADTETPAIKPEEWNTYRIVADGPMLSHYLNGRLMSQVLDEDPERRRLEGNIALQVHTGPPMRVEVRNMTLQPLHGSTVEMPSEQEPVLEQEPQWIWCSADPQNAEDCVLTRTFTLNEDAEQVDLRITCDNQFTAMLDGKQIATGNNWERPVIASIPDGLKRGIHELSVICRNEGGPAGLLAELTWVSDGLPDRLITDHDWLIAESELPITSFGPVSQPDGPWPNVFAGGKTTATGLEGELQLPPGFQSETVYEAAPGQGSWVAMTFDDQDRLIVSAQYGKLYRLTLPESDEEVLAEPIDLDIGGAQGLLHAHGALYAMVTRNGDDGGGIWRLRDTTGDDQYDSMEHLAKWGAGNEHGNHAMIMGPDGMIYVVQGNHTPLPPRSNPESPLRNWAEDDLLPRLWDANGHAVGVMTPGGVVMRTDPDITGFEIVSGGLRNAYDLAFNETGDLFTWDSDMEWDLGTPWYRPPRALHVVSGGEFGWRGGTAKWPDWYPDSLPTMLDMPQGSPTGMVFGGQSNFPEPWKSALFLADWTYGRIFAVHLEEDGAGWKGQQEIFASGRPFNVSDMVFGPDGDLYLVTGGRGTHSALYRIKATDAVPGTAPERSDTARELRSLRTSMESMHKIPDAGRFKDIRKALTSEDRMVRYAARIALERIPVEAWQTEALAEANHQAAIEMLLALAREESEKPENSDLIIRRALQIGSETEDPDLQRQAMRVMALSCARQGSPTTSVINDATDWLLTFTEDDDVHTRRLCHELLVHMQAPDLSSLLVARMEDASTQEDALHAALLARLVTEGWNDDLRLRYLQWLRRNQSLAGGRSIQGFVKAIEADAIKTWGPSDSERVISLVESPESVTRTALPRVSAWTMDSFEPHLQEVMSGRNFSRGRHAYKNARCLDCHRFHGQGGTTGPDLTGIGARFTNKDLLEAILEPSKVIADQYLATMVIRHDDTIDTGRLLESNEERVVLNIDPYGYETLEIPASEVAELMPSPVSTMPRGLANSLTLEDLLDLLAYLQTSGDPSHPAFTQSSDTGQ